MENGPIHQIMYDQSLTEEIIPYQIEHTDPLKIQICKLFNENYMVKSKQYYQTLIDKINALDFRARFIKSLEDGYAGFEVDKYHWIATFDIEMIENIKELLKTKIEQAGLKEVCYIHYQCDNICVLLHISSLGLVNPNIYSVNNIVVYDAGFIPKDKLESIDQSISDLSDKIEELSYRPGNIGSLKAYESFHKLSTKES
jgi:hypothetical protein